MKKTGWIVLSLAGLLTACNGDKQKAAGLLERANASFEAGDYNLAKLQIDSIRTFYPKAFDARKEGIRLMQRVDLEEQQKSLVYLDSMMAVKQAALDSLKPRKGYRLPGNRQLFLSDSGGGEEYRTFVPAGSGQ